MPNAFYFIGLIHGATRKPCPGERVWDAGQLVRGSVVRFLRARNQQGYDIYLLPYAEQCNAGYILIDLDHATADVLPRMRANGHEPCVVLQSSPGHLQAWIRVSTAPLEPALATAVSKQLARTYGGDLASTDGCHLGRLAGFTNQKLQRRTARGYAPWVKIVEAHAGIARAAQELAPPSLCEERLKVCVGLSSCDAGDRVSILICASCAWGAGLRVAVCGGRRARGSVCPQNAPTRISTSHTSPLRCGVQV